MHKGYTFYSWVVLFFACSMVLITNGMTFTGMTVFDEYFIDTFGWARGELKFRDLCTLATAGLFAPVGGWIFDKYGPTIPLMLGILCLSSSLAIYPHATELSQVYLLHVLFGLSLSFAGVIIAVLVTSRWFSGRHRGFAIGIAVAGTSIGNMVFPPLNSFLFSQYGFTTTMNFLAILAGASLILIMLGFRRTKLTPASAPESAEEKTGMLWKDAVLTKSFWLLATCAMISFFAIMAVASHLFLYLRSTGYQPIEAGSMLSLLFTLSFGGKVVAGWLTSQIPTRRVFRAALGCMFAGALCLCSGATFMFIILFGFGWGGLYTLIQSLSVETFGLKEGGRILGTITILDALGGGLGPYIVGLIYDISGTYQDGFLLIAGLVGLAVGASMFIKDSVKKFDQPSKSVPDQMPA